MAESGKKRKDLSLKDKALILEKYDKLPKMGQRNAALQLKISQPLLCNILKNREKILKASAQNENLDRKRNRSGKDGDIEAALKLWFTEVYHKDSRISAQMIREKANDLAKKMGKDNFVATDGWLTRWKKRENIIYKQNPVESQDTNFSSANTWFDQEWPRILCNFSPENVFFTYESVLYYRAFHEQAYMFKNENSRECKTSEKQELITFLCCLSLTGQKELLTVIGESKSHLYFKGIRKLPVNYYSNSKACMTTDVFNDWLSKWDGNLNHDICLLVDQSSSSYAVNVVLEHITVIFLPDNTASLFQSCVQGIIRAVKAYYGCEMRKRVYEAVGIPQNLSASAICKNVSLLDSLHVLALSWKKITSKTIENAFKKGGFLKVNESLSEEIFSDLQEQEKTVSDIKEDCRGWMLPCEAIAIANEISGDINSVAGDEGDNIHVPEHIEITPDIKVENCDSWISVDENIAVSREMNEVDVSSSDITGNEDNDLDPDDGIATGQSKNPPTRSQMRRALEVLRRGVYRRSDNFEIQYEYENFIHDLLRKKWKTD